MLIISMYVRLQTMNTEKQKPPYPPARPGLGCFSAPAAAARFASPPRKQTPMPFMTPGAAKADGTPTKTPGTQSRGRSVSKDAVPPSTYAHFKPVARTPGRSADERKADAAGAAAGPMRPDQVLHLIMTQGLGTSEWREVSKDSEGALRIVSNRRAPRNAPFHT